MQAGEISASQAREIPPHMATHNAFSKALKQARAYQGLTQEDFSDISSRTYISALERGLKSPTLEKIDALAATLELHPLTLLTLAYLPATPSAARLETLQQIVQRQLHAILSAR